MYVQLSNISEISDDLIFEQAYLVSKGVRALALVGSIPESDAMLRMATHIKLGIASEGLAIPFVITPYNDNFATCGFAAEEWVIDLLKWSWANMPQREHELLLGLMLGYSPKEIQDYTEYVASLRESTT